jgi:hypothetical protein
MKKKILLIILVAIIILIALFFMSWIGGSISPQISLCHGIYELDNSLNKEVNNDQEAFDILKEGMTYDSREGIVWVEDHISNSVTVEEALGGETPLLLKNQNIRLASGEIISDVWIIGYGRNKVLDNMGNIYLCEYSVPTHS